MAKVVPELNDTELSDVEVPATASFSSIVFVANSGVQVVWLMSPPLRLLSELPAELAEAVTSACSTGSLPDNEFSFSNESTLPSSSPA